MAIVRTTFQGVANIIRFNWHFYLLAIVVLVGLVVGRDLFPLTLQPLVVVGASLAAFSLMISLVASFYVYDYAGLYDLEWLAIPTGAKVLNINAGFDEVSELLVDVFPTIELTVCDFYDPERHTEISVQRARAAYPPPAGTVKVDTTQLPFTADSFDLVLAFLSAHEVRNQDERIACFRELRRILKPGGRILVTEHLRNGANILVYSLGAWHFHARETWLATFAAADLVVTSERTHTPLITTFTLCLDGDTP